MATSVGIVIFPGSCDEADAARAVRLTSGLEPRYLWHEDTASAASTP